jgi:hypothetical protein
MAVRRGGRDGDGSARMSGWHPQAARLLTPLLALAIAVSVVHYADNYFNYADYPQSADLPNPAATTVLASWFAFTAAGLAGYALFRRGPSPAALLLLAFYSGSGVVGLGHYAVPGATAMPWWRQAHVIADILCGFAILAFVAWSIRRRSTVPA